MKTSEAAVAVERRASAEGFFDKESVYFIILCIMESTGMYEYQHETVV